MKIKAIVLTGLVGSTLLLTGCGGGGGGGSSAATAIDGFNMTQGTADTKKGATYVQEFLTANNAVSTTVSDIYSRLNVPGVEQAHLDGWTGKGKTITVLDSAFSAGGHGRLVSDIAHNMAPGASRNEFGAESTINTDDNLATMASDVITTSIGVTPSYLAGNPSVDAILTDFVRDLESSNAVITVAAQHSNWTGTRADTGTTGRGGFTTCPNNATMTVANCNTWTYKGLDSSNVIYAGEVDSSDNIPSWSNQAGETHKNQFIVTSSDYITTLREGGTHGNSFAAPRVAGTAALVRQKFPNLSGAQTATTILHTADDLGVAGVDAVYGHGKLNVGKALAPVGNLH
jgi:hypothetical protein